MIWAVSGAWAQDRGARPDDAGFEGAEDDYVPPPRDRLFYSNATFARVNPLGLINVFRVGWQRRLSTSDSVLLRDTHVFVGPSAMLTPANGRLGGYAEAQLLSVLRVFASVESVAYFGTFDQILSFSDPTARYSDQTIATLGDQGLAVPRAGWVTTLGTTLRAAVGPVAVRTTPQLTRYDLSLPDGDVAFYDQYWDRLAPDEGFMVLSDTDALVLFEQARVGLRHTFSDHLDGTVGDAGMAHHRLGPLLAWQFTDHATSAAARFNHPTLFVLAQWWLQHPYRAGQEQPRGMPLFAVGLAFDGDLLRAPGAR